MPILTGKAVKCLPIGKAVRNDVHHNKNKKNHKQSYQVWRVQIKRLQSEIQAYGTRSSIKYAKHTSVSVMNRD